MKKNKKNSTIKIVELFAGVGGFHLAFDKASNQFEVIWANQYEPSKKKQFAFNIYQKNFPNTKANNEDIRKLDKKQIPEMDLLVAGFPCQDYSVANTITKGINGAKGSLWWDIKEVIELKKAKYLLFENVDRILLSPRANSKNTGRDFGIILRTLSELGYGVSWKVINAADYGHPQRRRRTFIFAFKKDTEFYNWMLKKKKEDELIKRTLTSMNPFSSTLLNESISEIEKSNIFSIQNFKEFSENFYLKKGFRKTGFMIEGEIFMADYIPKIREQKNLKDIIIQNLEGEEYYLTNEKIKKFEKLKGARKKERVSKTGFKYMYTQGKMNFPDLIDKPARTMVTSEGTTSRMTHVIKDPINNRLRLISPIEAERINTFPDNWTEQEGITKSNRYFMMGNALVVDLVKEICEEILLIINKDMEEK